MGILDDAIREHLDLKRRRGADPAEVERAEREALGPVRRNPDPADAAEPEADSAAGGGLAYDQDEEEDWSRESSHELGEDAGDDDLPDHDIDSEPDAADDPAGFRAPPQEEHDADAGPPAAGSDSPRRLSDMGGGETVEYDVEDALSADGDSDDDVLEETPEFLQDTPDHDRLWFEQRPPRDFDFDG